MTIQGTSQFFICGQYSRFSGVWSKKTKFEGFLGSILKRRMGRNGECKRRKRKGENGSRGCKGSPPELLEASSSLGGGQVFLLYAVFCLHVCLCTHVCLVSWDWSYMSVGTRNRTWVFRESTDQSCAHFPVLNLEARFKCRNKICCQNIRSCDPISYHSITESSLGLL